MDDQLELLLADGIIDEVLGRLKSGKEANVSLVRRGELVCAAKVYKDRETRSFKNNADYKEGRKVRNSRTQRAIESGGKFGRDADMQAWKSTEADALYKLAGSGVRIPAVIMFYEGVLLMDLVLDADGRPAPRLIDVSIDKAEALGIYADLVAQLISMLCCDVIHGDLSPYNILAAAEGPTIIDFPQMVSAVHSSRAEYFFLRDFDNVVKFMASFDPALAVHTADGRAIWRAYVSRELTPEFVPPPPPPPRPTRGPDRRGPPPQRGNGRGPQRNDQRGPQPQRNDQRGPQPQRNDQRGPQPQRNDQRGDQRPSSNDQRLSQPSHDNGQRSQPPRDNGQRSQPSRDNGQRSQPSHDNGQRSQPSHDNGPRPQPSHDNGPRSQPPRGTDRASPSNDNGQRSQPQRGNGQRSPQPPQQHDQRSPQPPRPQSQRTANDPQWSADQRPQRSWDQRGSQSQTPRGPDQQPPRASQPQRNGDWRGDASPSPQAPGAPNARAPSQTTSRPAPQSWSMPPPKPDAPAPSRGGRRRPKRRF